MTAYDTPNDSFTANDAMFYKKKVGQLHYTLQCLKLIVYTNIKITTSGKKFSVKFDYNQGSACKKYRNKEAMKTQEDYSACSRKVVVKKDWKTTLLLLPDYATDVEQSSRLSLP